MQYVMCDVFQSRLDFFCKILSLCQSRRETNKVAYGEFKGFLAAFCDPTQVAVICTL